MSAVIEIAVAAIIFWMVPAALSVMLVRLVRPRWCGLGISTVLLACSGWLIISLDFGLTIQYGGTPGWKDLWILLPLPILLLLQTIVRTRKPWRRFGHCQCGYDLTENKTGVCPECGLAVADLDPPNLH